MDSSKKKIIIKALIFVFFILFPLGQLIRINLNLGGVSVTLQPIDVVAGFSLFLLRSRKLNGFLLAVLFSYFFSILFFGFTHVLLGGLYLFRLLAYFSFIVVAKEWLESEEKYKKILINGLLLVSFFTGFFGWIQYLWFPDLRWLKLFGWDDHLYRLAGTFLDPGFTGLILVFGFLLSMSKLISTKDKKILVLLVFFLISIALTYSRASYLALLSGILVVVFLTTDKIKKLALFFILLFLILIPFLPRPTTTEGVKLERIFSIRSRISNYQETLKIWKESPLLGVGFNNICFARQKYLGKGSFDSHSCSGSDSSLLFILATTGLIGFITFLYLLTGFAARAKTIPFLACLAAVLVHSIFVNSLFYPWVMGWLGLLWSVEAR
jgi:O-antigen ligase